MKEYRTPESRCPVCSYKFNAASSTFNGDAKPRPHDFTVCLNCAALLRFNNDLTVRMADNLDDIDQGLADKLTKIIRLIDERGRFK